MVTLCALILGDSALDAKADLQAVFDRYKSLSSYSATIECQDASGLYPGHYVVGLKWSGRNKFEVKVIEPTKPDPKSPGNVAVPFFSDGSSVTRTMSDGKTDSRPLNTDPNLTPGYEVECGLVLSALLGSPTSDLLFAENDHMRVDFSYGKAEKWKGEKVKEIAVAVDLGGTQGTASFYLTPDSKWIVGMSYEVQSQKGSYQYKDAKYGESG